ncbi:hypothetical protein GCM10027298_08310 [Epidermidibacterium keratini]
MRARTLLLAVPILLAASACQGTGAAKETVTVTVTAEQITTDATPPPAANTSVPPTTTAPPPTTAAPAQSWVMPDLIGANLQVAQDTIQELTNFQVVYSSSYDATGAGRMQVLDSNWVVCSQTPLPGTTFDSTTPIDFGAVKIGEAC